MRLLFLFSFSLILFSCGDASFSESELTTYSPNGNLSVKFEQSENGEVFYRFSKQRKVLITKSSLGFSESELGDLSKDLVIEEVKSTEGIEEYDLPWGEVSSVSAGYSSIQLSLKHVPTKFNFTVEARLFDDGLGLRYRFPAQENVNMDSDTMHILEEHTTFNVIGDPLVNWGPGDWNSYENPVELTLRSKIDATKYDAPEELISRVIPHNAVMTPATMKVDSNVYMSIHEAALINYPEMTLGVTAAGFKSILAGTKRREAKAVVKLPFSTPWRTIQVEDRAIDLLANMLILNLNEPNQLGDVSWFEPKTYAGVWWEMHLGVGTWDFAGGQSTNTMMEVGSTGKASRHAARTERVKEYIDFCADNKITGLLVEGWNTGWEVWLDPKERAEVFDFVTPYPDYDLEEVVRYGQTKNVEIVMHHETSASVPQYEKQQDTAYALMQRLGIHSAKTGYVGNILPEGEYHHGQYMVNHFRNTYEKAAKYEVAINPHEPVKQTGERRTLPNAISAEAAKGMEYNSNGNLDGVNPPSHLPGMVYTRCLAGPFDYTPGIFRLDLDDYRGPGKGIGSTLGKQLGAYVVIYSPIQMVADLPEHYRSSVDRRSTGPDVAEATYHVAMERYIRYMATDWDATYPLAGELGQYAVIARKVKNEDRYFIGGIAGDQDQDVEVVLDFLPEGMSYELHLFADAEDAHYQTNRTALDMKNSFVKKGDTLRVEMKKAGGFGGIIELGVAE